MTEPFRLFSFGAGVQSVAVMVLMALGKLRYDALVFANVGEDSENPDTLRYLKQWAIPFADEFNIRFVEVQRTKRGKMVTLRQEIDAQAASVIIPAYMANGAPGNRTCTQDFKIRVIDKFIRIQNPRPERAIIGLGISIDEIERARSTEWHDRENPNAKQPHKLGFWKKREYPLLDLRMNRSVCAAIILKAGLPIPPKSSCTFCPFHRKNEWIEMKRTKPEQFANAVEVERICNAKRLHVGRDRVYLHSSLKPLEIAVADQLPLFPEPQDECVDGYCMV